jgi:hypothetical protein
MPAHSFGGSSEDDLMDKGAAVTGWHKACILLTQRSRSLIEYLARASMHVLTRRVGDQQRI